MVKLSSSSRLDLACVLSGERKYAMVCGDSAVVLPELPPACVDALILDPPSGIGVFGKPWDGPRGGRDQWIYEVALLLRAHRRVLKPGRLAFIWSYPRTSHWTGSAIENAGFEIIDCFYHLFSNRKPTSPKKLPKTACEPWWLCRNPVGGSELPDPGAEIHSGSLWRNIDFPENTIEVTKVSEDGVYYTYLGGKDLCNVSMKGRRSFWDPIAFRRMFVPCLQGVSTPRSGSKTPRSGSTPVDGSEAPADGSRVDPNFQACLVPVQQKQEGANKASAGRHTPTVILSHTDSPGEPCEPGCVVHDLDAMSGQLRSGSNNKVGKSTRSGYRGNAYGQHTRPEGTPCVSYGDSGGASRFFSVLEGELPFLYAGRASKAERNAGLPDGVLNEGIAVKPLALMRHLVKLANVPPGGIVLDGFAGTGSTGCACALEGVRFIGIEQDKQDAKVANYRISHHCKNAESKG